MVAERRRQDSAALRVVAWLARVVGCQRRRYRSSTVACWRRIVRHLRRVRQLQRLWGYLGQTLGLYPETLRRRLRDVDPTAYQRRWR